MAVTLAELDSRICLSLEPAAEFLDLQNIHNAAIVRLNIRTMQSRASTVHVLLGTSNEFTVTTLDTDITTLIGKGVPCFVEQHWISQDTLVSWMNIRVVPLNQMNDYRAMGALACAFYGSESASDSDQATQYLKFTYLPGQTCRIRFERDGQRIALANDILLPDNLAELVIREAQNDLIPAIQTSITMRTRRDADLRMYAKELKADLAVTYAQNEKIILQLDALWRDWAYGDRASEDNFNLPTPNSASVYAGGRGRGRNGSGGLGGNF